MKLSNAECMCAISQLEAGISAAQIARNFDVHEQIILCLRQHNHATGSVSDHQHTGIHVKLHISRTGKSFLCIYMHVLRYLCTPPGTHMERSVPIRRRLHEVGVHAR